MIHVIPKVPEFVQFIVQFRDQRGFDAVHDRLIVVYEASRDASFRSPLACLDASLRTRDVSPRFRNDFLTPRQLPLLFHPQLLFTDLARRGKRAFRAKARTSFHRSFPSSSHRAILETFHSIPQSWITVEWTRMDIIFLVDFDTRNAIPANEQWRLDNYCCLRLVDSVTDYGREATTNMYKISRYICKVCTHTTRIFIFELGLGRCFDSVLVCFPLRFERSRDVARFV